jgi:hypothetical protein
MTAIKRRPLRGHKLAPWVLGGCVLASGCLDPLVEDPGAQGSGAEPPPLPVNPVGPGSPAQTTSPTGFEPSNGTNTPGTPGVTSTSPATPAPEPGATAPAVNPDPNTPSGPTGGTGGTGANTNPDSSPADGPYDAGVADGGAVENVFNDDSSTGPRGATSY